MARYNGSDLFLYVAGSAPTDAQDPTDVAYSKVGQVIDLGLDSESEEVTITDRDGQSTLTGSLGYTLPFSAHYDYSASEDAGQALLWTNHLARTDLYWYIGTTTSGAVCFTGTAQPTSLSLGAGTDEGLVLDGSLGGQNAVTKDTTT